MDVIPDQEETGEEICPTPTVKLDGSELARDVDYTVTYSNNIQPGTATIVIEGIGNCSGTARATFEIVEAPEEDSSSNQPATIPLVVVAPVVVAAAVLLVIGVFAFRRNKSQH